MSIGAGLAAQIGFVQETTPGTPVTVSRFFEFDSESLAMKKKTVDGTGLRPDAAWDSAARRSAVQRDVQGDVQMSFPIKGAGILLQNMLGSFATTAVQQGVTTAYRQVHVPVAGAFTGKAMTCQVGKPGSNGTVVPFTYPGCKVTAWELSCAQSDLLKLKLTLDAMDELTPNSTPAGPALASASYPSGLGNFTFVQGALVLGGTVSTTGGVASVSGATAVAAVKSASITGTTPVDNERFFLGSAIKAEQIQNDFMMWGGQLGVEFNSSALYDQYRADGQAALQLTFTSPLLAGTGFPYLLQILMPAVFFEDGATPQVGGRDVLNVTLPFSVRADGANSVIQAVYTSTDTTP